MVRIFERYLADIGRERLLTREEEVRLARAGRAGDAAARRRLVSANLRFVVAVARGYRGRGLPLADLVNEGNLGLVQAAERFDPERGVRFISYAQFWVRRAIAGALAAHEEGSAAGGTVRRVSLDEPLSGSGAPLLELVADTRSPPAEARLTRESLRHALEASLADLPQREADVLRRYFGLGRSGPRSLGQIAAELGVSRERTRQLKDRALARLRAASHRHGLDGFAARPGRGRRRPRRTAHARAEGD